MPKLVSVLSAVVGAVLLTVIVAGCGSSGSEGSSTTEAKATTTTTVGTDTPADVDGITAEQYTEAFVSNLSTGDTAGADLVISKEQAQCVAPKFVAAITVEQLHESGATVEAISDPGFGREALDLTAEQGKELVGAFAPCGVDLAELFAAALTAGLTQEQQDCAVEKIDHEQALAYLATSFGGEQGDITPIQDALIAACDLPSS